ncbi:unnamed protein product [Ectocarpus sp. 13 AM-2016]
MGHLHVLLYQPRFRRGGDREHRCLQSSERGPRNARRLGGLSVLPRLRLAGRLRREQPHPPPVPLCEEHWPHRRRGGLLRKRGGIAGMRVHRGNASSFFRRVLQVLCRRDRGVRRRRAV